MKPSSRPWQWPWIVIPIVIFLTVAGTIGSFSNEFTLGAFGLVALYLLRRSTRMPQILASEQGDSFRIPVVGSTQRWMLVCGMLVIGATLISMNATAANIPENATSKRYGDSWTCNSGFREQVGGCAAILIPANAYANGAT